MADIFQNEKMIRSVSETLHDKHGLDEATADDGARRLMGFLALSFKIITKPENLDKLDLTDKEKAAAAKYRKRMDTLEYQNFYSQYGKRPEKVRKLKETAIKEAE